MSLLPQAKAADRHQQNADTYDRLYVSLVDGLGLLQILIAVCDRDSQRYATIERYESDLEGVAECLRVQLQPRRLNVKSAIEETIAATLGATGAMADLPIVVTVEGAERLDAAALRELFGYLQWTREGLRELAIPLVFWFPGHFLPDLAKKAPDFWSWRNGVFIFASEKEDLRLQGQPLESLPVTSADSGLFSLEQLEDSLAQSLAQWGENSPQVADLYAQLGKAYANRFDRSQGTDRAQALARSQDLLQRAIALPSIQPLALASSLNNLAELYRAMGRYEAALPLFQRSLVIWEQELGANHPDTASSLNNLAALYESMGRYEEALPLFQRSLAIDKEVYGENHPEIATDLNNLAGLYYSMGRYEAALPLFQRSLAIMEQELGANHPDTASSLNNLALLYQSMGRYEAALPLFQRSLAIREQELGANHPDTALGLNNLAGLYQAMGRYEEALPLYQRSVAIFTQILGPDHPNTQKVQNNLQSLRDTLHQSS